MKLRSILLACALVLGALPALAQVNPGTSPLSVAKGGTGRASLTSSALIFGNGTSPVGFLPLGNGVASALAAGGNTSGGFVIAIPALTANGVVYGAGSGASPGSTAAGSNGQFFLGVTSGAPQWSTMSQDCTVTNAGVMTCNKTNNVSFGALATTVPGAGVAAALAATPTGTGGVVLASGATLAPTAITGTTTNNNAPTGAVGEAVTCNASPNAAGTFPTATVTITIASPGVITWTAHPMTALSPVIFTTTGALPTGITASTVYYVIGSSITTNTFQIATSITNAIAGIAVNTSGTQSGVQTGTLEVPLTTDTPANVCAVNLTAGDWDIGGKIAFVGGGTTTVRYLAGSLGAVSATLDQSENRDVTVYGGNATVFSTLATFAYPLGPNRFSLASTTVVYLVGQVGFAVSTAASGGYILARRVR